MRQFIQHSWTIQQAINTSSQQITGDSNARVAVNAPVMSVAGDFTCLSNEERPETASAVEMSSFGDGLSANISTESLAHLDQSQHHTLDYSYLKRAQTHINSTASPSASDDDCFREVLVFARVVSPDMDSTAFSSLRVSMRLVREVLSLYPATGSLVICRTSGEVYFASPALVGGLGVRINHMKDFGAFTRLINCYINK